MHTPWRPHQFPPSVIQKAPRQAIAAYLLGLGLLVPVLAGAVGRMTSVYLLDGVDLRMTHFCTFNQPCFVAGPSTSPDALRFELVDVTNVTAPGRGQVGAAELERHGPDEITLRFPYRLGDRTAANVIDLRRTATDPELTFGSCQEGEAGPFAATRDLVGQTYGVTFDPSGSVAYFTHDEGISWSRLRDGRWSEPVEAAFSRGNWIDEYLAPDVKVDYLNWGPAFSVRDSRLLFGTACWWRREGHFTAEKVAVRVL